MAYGPWPMAIGQAEQLLDDLRMARLGGYMKSSILIAVLLLHREPTTLARLLERGERLLNDLRMARRGGATKCSSQAMAACMAGTMAESWPRHGLAMTWRPWPGSCPRGYPPRG